MTLKQQRFVEEYLCDLNATQAAIRAGYKHPDIGRRLVTKSHVQEAIVTAQHAQSKRTLITADRVLHELAKIGFANMADYMRVGSGGDPVLDFSALTRDQAAALVEVTVEDFMDGRGDDARDVRKVKFKLADKRAALVDIGKHLGMFTDRTELTGKDGTPLSVPEITVNFTKPVPNLDALTLDEKKTLYELLEKTGQDEGSQGEAN